MLIWRSRGIDIIQNILVSLQAGALPSTDTPSASACDNPLPPPLPKAGPLSLSTIAAVAAHDKDVNALTFSPNDTLLATASQDRSIKLWKLPSLVLSATLKGHKRGVWDIAFSPSEQVGGHAQGFVSTLDGVVWLLFFIP